MLVLMKRFGVLSLSLCLALPACGKKSKDDEDDGSTAAEDVPPPSPYSVSLDLSLSESGTNTDDDAVNLTSSFTATAAYTASSALVTAVGVSLGSQMLVPVLLLKGASKASATALSDTSYLWSFDFTNAGAKFTGNLTGTKSEDVEGQNAFSMSVTRTPANSDGCCTNFVFFTGTNSPADGGGSWQIFDPTRPTGQEKLFSVIYSYKSVTERTLSYTVNSDRVATQKFGNGTTIVYNVKGTTVTLTYHDSSEQGSRIVSWDKDTLAGSIVDLQGQKLCWDSKANGSVDVACPGAGLTRGSSR